MSAYLASLVGVSLVVSLALALSYKEGGTEKLAYGVLLLYAAVMPLLGAIGEIDVSALALKMPGTETQESATDEACEEAFVRGICLFIADEFSLDVAEIEVSAHGFVLSEMRAELITVRLSGDARLADFRAIRESVKKNGFGECEVEIAV